MISESRCESNVAPCAWTAALALARRGIPVFPATSDKVPLVRRGFKGATCDPDVIHRWWVRWPDALISVPTGERFVVVDLDLQHVDALQWLEDNRHRLPLTRTHATRSGGKHFLFKPHDKIKCTTSKLGPHVDTKGNGGCIVWWPAHGFEVLHARALTEVPEWIVKALEPPPEPPRPRTQYDFSAASVQGIVRTIIAAREGERNAIVFWAANRLAEMAHAGDISRDQAIELVIDAAKHTGLPERESRATVLSAFKGVFK